MEPTEEVISFHLILNLEGELKNNCLIECEFYLQFLPLKINISTSCGQLFIHNDLLKLNVGEIFELSIIDLTFDISNFDNYEIFNSSYYIIAQDDNKAKKPRLRFKKENKSLEIEINDYENNKDYLHFIIFMYITEDIIIKIEIETRILKYEYVLSLINLYDEYSKEFKNKNYIIYNNEKMNPSIKINLLDQRETIITIIKKLPNKKAIREEKKIKDGYILDLKEINELNANCSLELNVIVYFEKNVFNLKNNKSLSYYSVFTEKDIKDKIEKNKKEIKDKRNKEKIKYDNINDDDLYKKICFTNSEDIKFQGIDDNEENEESEDDIDLFTENDNSKEIVLKELPQNFDDITKIEGLNSLNDYIRFYNNYTEILETVPYRLKLDKSPYNESQKLLNFLYHLYQYSKNYKLSILSLNISSFMKSFEDIYIILNQSGIQFPTKIIKNTNKSEKIHYNSIQEPKLCELHIRDKTLWIDENLILDEPDLDGNNWKHEEIEIDESIIDLENNNENHLDNKEELRKSIQDKKYNKKEINIMDNNNKLNKSNSLKRIESAPIYNSYQKLSSTFIFEDKEIEIEEEKKNIPKPELCPINLE